MRLPCRGLTLKSTCLEHGYSMRPLVLGFTDADVKELSQLIDDGDLLSLGVLRIGDSSDSICLRDESREEVLVDGIDDVEEKLAVHGFARGQFGLVPLR